MPKRTLEQSVKRYERALKRFWERHAGVHTLSTPLGVFTFHLDREGRIHPLAFPKGFTHHEGIFKHVFTSQTHVLKLPRTLTFPSLRQVFSTYWFSRMLRKTHASHAEPITYSTLSITHWGVTSRLSIPFLIQPRLSFPYQTLLDIPPDEFGILLASIHARQKRRSYIFLTLRISRDHVSFRLRERERNVRKLLLHPDAVHPETRTLYTVLVSALEEYESELASFPGVLTHGDLVGQNIAEGSILTDPFYAQYTLPFQELLKPFREARMHDNPDWFSRFINAYASRMNISSEKARLFTHLTHLAYIFMTYSYFKTRDPSFARTILSLMEEDAHILENARASHARIP